MSRRTLVTVIAVTYSVLMLVCVLLNTQAEDQPAPDKEVFALTRVWAIHLDISTKEYQALQPSGGFGFPGGPGKPPVQPPKKDGEKRDSDRNLFGMQFPWVQGELTADGKTYKKVGLRYDGNASYLTAARGLKRSFKIDLGRHDD
ncbi:MAG: hypothetical protein L0Z62_10195 [Gemmataceae bacterium]|nr:hypothetical protein [Gemmataceae bacterium]